MIAIIKRNIFPTPQKNLTNHRLLSASMPIFCGLTFFRFYFDSETITKLATGFLIFYGLLYFTIYRKLLKGLAINALLSTVFIFTIFNSIFSKNNTAATLIFFLVNLGFSISILAKNLNPKIAEINFYFYCAFFLILIFNGKNPESVFNVSRNFISIFVILIIGIYYIACQQNNIYPKIQIPLLGLLICIWGTGRAGILSLSIITISTLLLSQKNKTLKTVCIFSALAILRIGIEQGNTYPSIFIETFDRFNRLGLEDVRNNINRSYLIEITSDFSNFIIGAELNSIQDIVAVNGNPHNSFIRLHTNYGIFGLTIIIVTIIISLFKALTFKKYVLAIIGAATIFRSFFDVASFYGPLDVIIFYIIISQFIKNT